MLCNKPENFNLHIDSKGGYSYYTFTHALLCDTLKIRIDEEMTALLAKAHRLLGLLEGMSAFLPNIAAVESVFMYKEALWSCQIDKIEAPFYVVLDASQKITPKTLPLKNNVMAMQNALNVSEQSFSNHNLCDIHMSLMKGMGDEFQGGFREKQIFFNACFVEDFQIIIRPHQTNLILLCMIWKAL